MVVAVAVVVMVEGALGEAEMVVVKVAAWVAETGVVEKEVEALVVVMVEAVMAAWVVAGKAEVVMAAWEVVVMAEVVMAASAEVDLGA
jgi:hypothetical protein